MNVGYIVGIYLDKLLKRMGARGMERHIAGWLGPALAGLVVEVLVKYGVKRALQALGGKIGLLAGPAGAVIGWIIGAA